MPVHRLVDNIRRESRRQYTPPLRAAILFSIPPSLIVLGANGHVHPTIAQIASLLVVGVTIAYHFSIKGYFAKDFDPQRSDFEFSTNSLQTDTWTIDDFEPEDEAAILVEYEQLADERRASNKIVIQATYFSLATFGILGTVFLTRTTIVFKPILAEFGMFISFAFLIIVEKHVRIRQALRKRQEQIESIPSFDGRVSVATTWETALRHGLYPGADISEQLIDFNRFWLWAWIIVYHVSTLYVAFVVLPR